MSDLDTRASTRRIAFYAVVVVAALSGVALAGPRLLRWFRPGSAPAAHEGYDSPPTEEEIATFGDAERKLERAERKWQDGKVLAPRESTPNADGERTRWFQGFGLSVETTPRGAEVLVDGESKGETPLVTGVDCQPGDEVRVEVRRAGQPARARTVRCRKDQLVELTVDLR